MESLGLKDAARLSQIRLGLRWALMGSGGGSLVMHDYPTQMVGSCISVGKEWELVILVIVLETIWWFTPLVVSKMMLISGGKVAWVMSELKVDARRSDVGTRLLRRRGQQPTHFSNWLSFSNRQRLIQNLKQRITLINENLKRRCIFQLKFWNNAVCRCHF